MVVGALGPSAYIYSSQLQSLAVETVHSFRRNILLFDVINTCVQCNLCFIFRVGICDHKVCGMQDSHGNIM